VPYFDEPAGQVKIQTASKNTKAILHTKKSKFCLWAPTCTANRFSSVQIVSVQYHCIFVLLLGPYSLQLDNNVMYQYATLHIGK